MDQQTAKLALQFLSRAQIQGSEVQAFLQVVGALNQIAEEATKRPAKAKRETRSSRKRAASSG